MKSERGKMDENSRHPLMTCDENVRCKFLLFRGLEKIVLMFEFGYLMKQNVYTKNNLIKEKKREKHLKYSWKMFSF